MTLFNTSILMGTGVNSKGTNPSAWTDVPKLSNNFSDKSKIIYPREPSLHTVYLDWNKDYVSISIDTGNGPVTF